MKQEAKGKIFVGMIVSIVAFGFATGTGFLMGANPINTQGILNLTQQGQFPAIPATNLNTNTTKNTNQINNTQTSQSSNSGQTNTNTNTPSNPNTSNNNNNTNTNSNTNSNSDQNTNST